jgi:hypothetical protein
MSSVRRKRQAIAWLLVVAFLSNALAFAAHWSAVAVVDHGLGPMVICTADGAKTIPGDKPSGSHANDHCPACRLVAPFMPAVPLTESAIDFLDRSAEQPRPISVSQVASRFRPSDHRSRAPPLCV